MGGSFSKSNNCENYKNKIVQLNKELNDYKSGLMLPANAGDPYNEYTGGKKKKNKRNKKTKKHKNK
jgi:hypothetical protein